jgi:hypothetical protein
MPLESRTIEIPLAGLSEKHAAIVRSPGTMQRARNVEFDKTGIVNKRRGYRFVDVAQTINLFDTDSVFSRCATIRNELVLFSHSHVVSLISQTGSVRADDTLVYRGPCNRGALKLEYITGGTYTENEGGG